MKTTVSAVRFVCTVSIDELGFEWLGGNPSTSAPTPSIKKYAKTYNTYITEQKNVEDSQCNSKTRPLLIEKMKNGEFSFLDGEFSQPLVGGIVEKWRRDCPNMSES